MRAPLIPHPDTPCDAVRSLTVEVRRGAEPDVLALTYVLDGDLARIALPSPGSAARTDELWKHTCFEAFVRAVGDEAYCELNLAPSTQWAAYTFSGYRRGMSAASMSQPQIAVSRGADVFDLRAHVALPSLPRPAVLALSAVIEETNGAKSYWALAHAPGKPDFHHPDAFVLELP